MAEFAARVSFEVVYRANTDELFARERITKLADTMLSVLKASPKIRVIDIVPGEIEDVEQIGE